MGTRIGRALLVFFQHLQVRMALMIAAVLSIGIGLTVFHSLRSQEAAAIGSRQEALREEAEMLAVSIRNGMLSGDAPIVADLLGELSRSELLAEIRLFRADGVIAFSDSATIKAVNRRLDEKRFAPGERSVAKEGIRDPHFSRSVKNAGIVFAHTWRDGSRRVRIYMPLVNQPRCAACHGADHRIRGVVAISSPIDNAIRGARLNAALLATICGAIALILLLAVVVLLDRFVIKRIHGVRRVLRGVGRGDFSTRLESAGRDEIDALSAEINGMIDGLYERFSLSVSPPGQAPDRMRGVEDPDTGGERRLVTVLCSDIRGFFSFSAGKDPRLVMKVLNEVMNLQADVIRHFGGHIHTFAGDELTAVFEGNEQAISALRAAHEIRRRLKLRYAEEAIRVGTGVNTGEVISGYMVSGGRIDRTIIGDTVNTAVRLCAIAGRNTIVISEFTCKLAGDGVEVLARGAIRGKSRRQPVNIFTLRRVL